MGNFLSRIFGSIALSKVGLPAGMDFIPAGSDSEVIRLDGADASWLGLDTPQMQYWAYVFCSPLAAVIDRLAEADTNGEILFLKNNKAQDVSNSAITKRLKAKFKQPNPIQTWEDFRGQQIVNKKVFGYAPVYVMRLPGNDVTEPSFLWNLNPYYVKPIKNYDFSLINGGNPIKLWRINIFGRTYDIQSESIMLLKDGFIDTDKNDLFLPKGKVEGLEWAVSNTCAAMEADNVLLRKKGPLGFISHDPKPDNVAGYVPMTAQQKKEIQENLGQYGLTWSQFQYVITKLPVRWNPMSFNVKDLMTKETVRQAIDMMCDRFNYPAELMSGKNATYENRNSAEKFLYQNNIIPNSLRDMRVYNSYFEMEQNDLVMQISYDHLPVLQEDIQKAAQARKDSAEGNLMLFQNSVITLNQYRTREGIDTVANDDIYYAEYLKKYKVEPAPMKVVPGAKKEAA